ncbi:MAG: hypothetical protein KDA93_21135 [Planctomycetaceae bacterium]|nr:hypothetical protein [Planctomycetaceae bacterium]
MAKLVAGLRQKPEHQPMTLPLPPPSGDDGYHPQTLEAGSTLVEPASGLSP